MDKKAERLQEPEGVDDTGKYWHPDTLDKITYVLPETGAACIGPAQIRAKWGYIIEREWTHELPPLTKNLSSTDIYL